MLGNRVFIDDLGVGTGKHDKKYMIIPHVNCTYHSDRILDQETWG